MRKAGAVNALLRFGTSVAAATGADIIAANPDDVQTLGNLFPELLPTGIDPDDPALLKRLKLGVEAGTITAGALSALGGTLFALKSITKLLRPFFKSDEIAQETERARDMAGTAACSHRPTLGGSISGGFLPNCGTRMLDDRSAKVMRSGQTYLLSASCN